MVYPLGLAASGDALFVGDWATGRIWKIDRSGRTVVASGLVHPEGLALDRAGGLLVVEADAGRVSRIDLATGAMRVVASGLALGLTGQPPAEAAHLTLNGVAVAPSGAIFATGDKDDVLLSHRAVAHTSSPVARRHDACAKKRGRLYWVPFAREITPEEMALGFQCVDYAPHGLLVTAKLGIGIRAVKMIEQGLVSYIICDDEYIVLYPSALSIADLRLRFGLGDGGTKAG